MSFYTLGDLAQFRILSQQGRRLRAQMDELTLEATTGLVNDKTARLKGNFVQVAGIESRLAQIEAYRTVTTEQLVLTNSMQTAISAVTDQSNALGSKLLAGVSSLSELRISSLADEATSTLDGIFSALNAQVADRTLFSGQITNGPTYGSTSDMMDALEASITAAGATSPDDIENAVDAWFADPAGFQATTYLGGAAQEPVPVGPGEVSQVDVTGMDPALVSMIKGVAMTVLLARGALTGSVEGRSDMMRRSGEQIAASQELLASMSARLGTVQGAMQNAATRNDAEKSTLEVARLDLISADQYDTAAKYQETQGQLESLYTLTSRASRLSLVDYL
jgi:flagellar hook-associated protein 3 FlgL